MHGLYIELGHRADILEPGNELSNSKLSSESDGGIVLAIQEEGYEVAVCIQVGTAQNAVNSKMQKSIIIWQWLVWSPVLVY